MLEILVIVASHLPMHVPETALEFGLIIWTGTCSFSPLPTIGLMAAMAMVFARCDGGQDHFLRRNYYLRPITLTTHFRRSSTLFISCPVG